MNMICTLLKDTLSLRHQIAFLEYYADSAVPKLIYQKKFNAENTFLKEKKVIISVLIFGDVMHVFSISQAGDNQHLSAQPC